MRLGHPNEAWIAPPAARELREMVPFRAKLPNIGTRLKAHGYAVMDKNGVPSELGNMWGRRGAAQLNAFELLTPAPIAWRCCGT